MASFAFTFPVGAQDTNETAGGGEFTPGVQPATLTEGNFVRHFSVKSSEEAGCPEGAVPCWDVNTLVVLPGDKVVIHVDMTSGTHDMQVEALEVGTPKGRSGVHDLAFVVPDSIPAEGIEYICSVHPETMVGTMNVESALGAHEAAANTLGVHFLAYWVGVIAFAILFVVYGLTFFLFKYNETRATTDHWDRSETPGESKRLAAIAPLLAVVIAVAAIAAIVYMASR